MNEQNPEMIPIESISLPAFKDRSIGLVIFGILTILMGCIVGLFVLLMMAGLMATAQNPTVPPTPVSSLLLVIFMYVSLAVCLIWLGIGSIMARRWARALLLIFSWAWLVMGTLMVIFLALLMPKIFATVGANGQPAMPPGAATGIMIFMLFFFGFFFILLPAIWVFFYMSRHVKATCEARDPVARWTDACPLPVLGLSLWLLVGVPILLIMPISAHGVVPFFGMFLDGVSGSLVCVAVAALWAYCSWRLYKLDVRGWWIALIAMLAYITSSLLTFTRHDMLEMYQRMGYPQAQIDQIQKSGLMTQNNMVWMTLLFMAPFLGYLLFIKKYLKKQAA